MVTARFLDLYPRAYEVDSPAILYLELFGNLPTITLISSRRYVSGLA
jgi:hypothetical protein